MYAKVIYCSGHRVECRPPCSGKQWQVENIVLKIVTKRLGIKTTALTSTVERNGSLLLGMKRDVLVRSFDVCDEEKVMRDIQVGW